MKKLLTQTLASDKIPIVEMQRRRPRQVPASSKMVGTIGFRGKFEAGLTEH